MMQLIITVVVILFGVILVASPLLVAAMIFGSWESYRKPRKVKAGKDTPSI